MIFGQWQFGFTHCKCPPWRDLDHFPMGRKDLAIAKDGIYRSRHARRPPFLPGLEARWKPQPRQLRFAQRDGDGQPCGAQRGK
jgi:hypothetical protein